MSRDRGGCGFGDLDTPVANHSELEDCLEKVGYKTKLGVDDILMLCNEKNHKWLPKQQHSITILKLLIIFNSGKASCKYLHALDLFS